MNRDRNFIEMEYNNNNPARNFDKRTLAFRRGPVSGNMLAYASLHAIHVVLIVG